MDLWIKNRVTGGESVKKLSVRRRKRRKRSLRSGRCTVGHGRKDPWMGEFAETMGLNRDDDSISGNDIGAVKTLEGVIGEREYGNESNQNGW